MATRAERRKEERRQKKKEYKTRTQSEHYFGRCDAMTEPVFYIDPASCAATQSKFLMTEDSLREYAEWKDAWEKRQAAMTPQERFEEARKQWE